MENHYRDVQDMEFTIENGKLFMLQTRNGKRTAQAALKIACDMVDEGLINTDEALMMVEPQQLDSLLHPMFDADALAAAEAVTSALPASPGAGSGQTFLGERRRKRKRKRKESHSCPSGNLAGRH